MSNDTNNTLKLNVLVHENILATLWVKKDNGKLSLVIPIADDVNCSDVPAGEFYLSQFNKDLADGYKIDWNVIIPLGLSSKIVVLSNCTAHTVYDDDTCEYFVESILTEDKLTSLGYSELAEYASVQSREYPEQGAEEPTHPDRQLTHNGIMPNSNRLLIEPKQAEGKTAGGIIIPDSAKEVPAEGVIKAVGPTANAQFKGGEIVMYSKYAGSDIEYKGKKYKLLRDDDVLALLAE